MNSPSDHLFQLYWYVNGENEIVNTEVSRTNVARVLGNFKLELPAHPEMRRNALLDAEKWMLPDPITTVTKDDKLDEAGRSDAVVTRDLVRSEAEDTSTPSIIRSSTAVSVRDDKKLDKLEKDGEDTFGSYFWPFAQKGCEFRRGNQVILIEPVREFYLLQRWAQVSNSPQAFPAFIINPSDCCQRQ